MSVRTLIELNHDCVRNDSALVEALARYAASGTREDAEALERFGLTVLGLRHHSGRYYVESEPDGFPLIVHAPVTR